MQWRSSGVDSVMLAPVQGHMAGGQCRKEKSTSLGVKQEPVPSQSSSIAIASTTTRSSAFESSSVGSASGSEVYSQHSLVATEGSLSPPTTSINFVHYSHPPLHPPRGLQPQNE